MRMMEPRNEDHLDFDLARLFALEAAEMLRARDLVEWALRRLEAGAPETGIAILAGLDPEAPYWDGKTWFRQALIEMGIDPPDPVLAMDRYLEGAARGILDGTRGFRELLAFARQTGILPVRIRTRHDLWIFRTIESELADWEAYEGDPEACHQGISPSEAEAAVRRECEILLGLAPAEAPPIPYVHAPERKDYAGLAKGFQEGSPGSRTLQWILAAALMALFGLLSRS